MQSTNNPSKQSSLKQFKVDNWSIFFLQRLLQLYSDNELLDLTIKFPTSEYTIQAHRLVVTTCTDYFIQLERIQKKNKNFNGILMMPPDMPYECVKAIISFMYTGHLDYWTSEQTALYKTAEKMNMTVLTKLLDAQSSTPVTQSQLSSSSSSSIIHEEKPMSLGQQSLNSYKKTNQELPLTPLPGRKLPIWRRKLDTPSTPTTTSTLTSASSSPSSTINDTLNYGKRKYQSTSGPSRFELPDIDDMTLGVFSSFDDITYNTKPIVKAEIKNKNDSNNHSLNINKNKNDTTEDDDDDDDDDDNNIKKNKQWNDDNNSDDDWSGPKGILRDPIDVQQTPSKRVRFELEEKENLEKQEKNTNDSINRHTKIVREVLKKYPHLVKNNQNIRLKIMQKESKSNDTNTPSKTKVSYLVIKSDHLMVDNNDTQLNNTQTPEIGENGMWKCPKCDIIQEYTKYYMYRRHMQDVHDEKFDPRICEHCGYKATKRNILMYHMYTKHNIQPPKNMSFPKCHACNYVALSDTLLARHQINHNHRQSIKNSRDEIQCVDCNLKFIDINDLASHEISSGHGKVTNSKEHRGYRCQYCSKCFVRPVNLQTHIETMHKNTNINEEIELPIFRTTLEPSSEAESLNTVVSGIATSLGVDNNDDDNDNNHHTNNIHHFQQQQQVIATSDGEYLVPEIDIGTNYNGQEFIGGQMIYLIDGNTYQHSQLQQLQIQHQQPQQLELTSNEQIVMQGTNDGMVVYIAGNDDNNQQQQQQQQQHNINNQVYQTYHEIQQNDDQLTEEILEEIEEEEEEEEVVEEVEEVVEEIVEEIDNNSQNDDDCNNYENIEGEIQYVEETEVVEYDDEQNQNEQDSTVIEEEQLDNPDEKIKQVSTFSADWDESSEEINET